LDWKPNVKEGRNQGPIQVPDNTNSTVGGGRTMTRAAASRAGAAGSTAGSTAGGATGIEEGVDAVNNGTQGSSSQASADASLNNYPPPNETNKNTLIAPTRAAGSNPMEDIPQFDQARDPAYDKDRQEFFKHISTFMAEINELLNSSVRATLRANPEWTAVTDNNAIVRAMHMIKTELDKRNATKEEDVVENIEDKIKALACGCLSVISFNKIFNLLVEDMKLAAKGTTVQLANEEKLIKWYLRTLPNSTCGIQIRDLKKTPNPEHITLLAVQAYYARHDEANFGQFSRNAIEQYSIPEEMMDYAVVRTPIASNASINAVSTSSQMGNGRNQKRPRNHPQPAARAKPTVDKKDRVCRFFASAGGCGKYNCQYLHERPGAAKNVTGPNYTDATSSSQDAIVKKRKLMCNKFMAGIHCEFGSNCKYSHDPADKVAANLGNSASQQQAMNVHKVQQQQQQGPPSIWNWTTQEEAAGTSDMSAAGQHVNAASQASSSSSNDTIHNYTVDETTFNVHTNNAIVAAQISTELGGRITILDSGSQLHVTDRHRSGTVWENAPEITVKGISSTEKVNFAIKSAVFSDPFYVVPTCTMDIISLGLARTDFLVSVNSSADTITLTDRKNNKNKLIFNLYKNLYVLANGAHKRKIGPEGETHCKMLSIETVNEAPVRVSDGDITNKYNKPLQMKLQALDQLHLALHHPSDESLRKLLDFDGASNFPIKASEINYLRNLAGPCEACTIGKSRMNTNPLGISTAPTTKIGEKVYSDIFTIKQITYLGMWDDYSNMGHIYPLQTKAKLPEGVQSVGMEYKRCGHNIGALICDHEAAYTALQRYLPIHVKQRAPGVHEHAAERHIQLLQQRVRATLASLSYKLPDNLLPYLVVDVQAKLNLMPTTRHEKPPHCAFHNVPIIYNINVQTEFGALVMVNVPLSQLTSKSSTLPRAVKGIVIGRDVTTPGAIKVYTLDGRHINAPAIYVERNQMEVLRTMGVNQHQGQATEYNNLFSSHPIPPSADCVAGVDARCGQYQPEVAELDRARSNGNEDNEHIVMQPNNTEVRKTGKRKYDCMHKGPVGTMTNHEVPNTEAHDSEVNLEEDEENTSTKPECAGKNPEVPTSGGADDTQEITSKCDKRKPIREVKIRRSERERKATVKNILEEEEIEITIAEVANLSIAEAVNKHPNKGPEAIMAELKQMVEQKVWRYLNTKEPNSELIPSRMFIKEKVDANGRFEKIKARLVAGGHRQSHGDGIETYAPTADATTVMTVLNVAINQQKYIRAFDIKGAYLHAILDEQNINMKLDPKVAEYLVQVDPTAAKFLRTDGSIITKLNKALYGLIQSANLWFNLVKNTLEKEGFKNHEFIDNCLFTKETEQGKIHVTVTVDDVFATAHQESELDKLEKMLRDKFQTITVNKVTDQVMYMSHLGLHIKYDRIAGIAMITQPHYIGKLLVDNGIKKTATSPMNPASMVPDQDSPNYNIEKYRSEIYRVMYLATRTRPDVMFAASYLATRVNQPTEKDWNGYIHLLEYLNKTKELGIIFRRGTQQVSSYIDASYNTHVDGKSHSGAVCKLNDTSAAVACKSTKQKTTADSSCAAEIIALSTYAKMAVWYKNLLKALGMKVDYITVHQDNKATIQLATSGPTARGKSKWMDIKYFVVKELVDTNQITIKYCPTKDNIADILTKPLTGQLFIDLRNKLLGYLPQDLL